MSPEMRRAARAAAAGFFAAFFLSATLTLLRIVAYDGWRETEGWKPCVGIPCPPMEDVHWSVDDGEPDQAGEDRLAAAMEAAIADMRVGHIDLARRHLEETLKTHLWGRLR